MGISFQLLAYAPPAHEMEALSLVSKARTAFHSAAAKAERVFTDIKKSDSSADRDSEKQSPNISNPGSPNSAGEARKGEHEVKYLSRKPHPLKTKQDLQERLKNIKIGKKGVEDFEKAGDSPMAFAIFDENLYLISMREVSESKPLDLLRSKGVQGVSERVPIEEQGSEISSSLEDLTYTDIIPSASVMKQLSIAIEAGKRFKFMRDLVSSSRDSSPVRERAFSAVKSLVLREKEDKFTAEFGGDEKVVSMITSLLGTEGQFSGSKICAGLDTPTSMISLPKDIHGAPPQSFVVKLSEVIGSFKTSRKMAVFWYKVVAELRRLWYDGVYVPGIPTDEIPDLSSCLLYQKLQVINCCISRKNRRSIATESLDYVIRKASSNVEDQSAVSEGTIPVTPVLYAKTSTGELVLRLGADKRSDTLTMLETGEPVYTPVMQEGPLLTEDLIKETEELVLRTGSVGAGCSQLFSDMQAFKAANPGCLLEDFVRWHSPPDWTETEPITETENLVDADQYSARGQLSGRMQKEGNLWRELWLTAKPVPAVKQTPLFDEDMAVEGILNDLEDITSSGLFEQLFVSLLGSGFVIAEEKLPTDVSLSKLFYECKDYIIATCQSGTWTEKVDDICQVYETVEMMLLRPDEVLKILKQPEDTGTTAGEPKGRFKRLSIIFGSKDRHSGKPAMKDQNGEDNPPRRHSFSSIFSKRPPRPETLSPAEKPVSSIENDWTVV